MADPLIDLGDKMTAQPIAPNAPALDETPPAAWLKAALAPWRRLMTLGGALVIADTVPAVGSQPVWPWRSAPCLKASTAPCRAWVWRPSPCWRAARSATRRSG
ncbi:hypothetical protein V8F63_10195 [Brevundimonas sp. LF-1]|uniref:hypothetical protein n=1 Tax=Brevundimonas sp. LF-1 TaxID=3126100 RepID=UPI0030E101BC